MRRETKSHKNSLTIYNIQYFAFAPKTSSTNAMLAFNT